MKKKILSLFTLSALAATFLAAGFTAVGVNDVKAKAEETQPYAVATPQVNGANVSVSGNTFTVKKTSGVTWEGTTVSLPTDISMYNGVSYYVDLSGVKNDIYFNKYITEKTEATRPNGNVGKEFWYSNIGAAMYYPDPGTKEYTELGAEYSGHVNRVPAGFKGTIVVPFVSFAPDQGWSLCDNIFNLKDIEKFGITFDCSVGGGSFTLKDFKLVSNAQLYFTLTEYRQNQTGGYGEAVKTQIKATAGSVWNAEDYVQYVKNEGYVFDEYASTYLADDTASYVKDFNKFTVNPIIGSDTSAGEAKDYGRGNAIWRYAPKLYYKYADPFQIADTYHLKQPVTTNASQVKIEGDTFTVTKAGSSSWTSALFSDFPTNLSRFNGISFYIDLSSSTENIFFNKYLTESKRGDKNGTPTREIWYSNNGASMYYPDPGTPEYTKYGAEYSGNINTIPAGFKGTVVTAFVGFANDWSQVDKVFDLTAIKEIGITFDRSVGGGSFTLKDFKLVSDAKVYLGGSINYQSPDGRFRNTSSFGTVKLGRKAYLAGSAFTPDKEVTVGSETYVLDEERSQYNLTEDASYLNHSFKQNVIVGTETLTGNNQYYGMGNAMWRYTPTLYYVYKNALTIEKVFGLDNVKTAFPKGTESGEVLAQFPTGGVTVGNDRGGFSQIKGEWKITEQTEEKITVSFEKAVGETAMLDPNGLLSVEIELFEIAPTGIEVTPPTNLTYTEGEELDLTGLVVTLHYNDGTSETVTEGYTISGYDKNTVGTQTITVTYQGFTATFEVTVEEEQLPPPTPGGSDSSSDSSGSGSSDTGSSDTGSSDTGSSSNTDTGSSSTENSSSSNTSGGCFSASVALPLAGVIALAVVMIKRRKEV